MQLKTLMVNIQIHVLYKTVEGTLYHTSYLCVHVENSNESVSNITNITY